jgi:phenylalanyl-tRNA synthetase beta chain
VPPVVPLRPQRLERVIGLSYSDQRIAEVLGRLGYEAADGGWRVPSWRAADTWREVDLIEEVSRIDGFWKVPTVMPPHADAVGGLVPEVRLRRRVVDVLLGSGLSEAVTTSFWDEGMAERLRLPEDHVLRQVVRVANPMGADQALLRTAMFPGLLDAVRRNVDAGRARVELFETGRVVLPSSAEIPDQPVRVAGVVAGDGAGFARMKGVTEALAAALGVELAVERTAEPFLHPGRSARLGESGLLGELHPLVAEAFGIEVPVALFEIGLDELSRAGEAVELFRDVVSFPPVRQDIAVVLDAEVTAAELLSVVREAGGELLASAEVFDVYEGPQVGEGRRSLAVHLVFQATDRTLTDDEADAVRAAIVSALAERLGGELRA